MRTSLKVALSLNYNDGTVIDVVVRHLLKHLENLPGEFTMYSWGNIVAKTLKNAVLPIVTLLALSGCAAPADQVDWGHVHDGLLIGNIYTGDDGI